VANTIEYTQAPIPTPPHGNCIHTNLIPRNILSASLGTQDMGHDAFQDRVVRLLTEPHGLPAAADVGSAGALVGHVFVYIATLQLFLAASQRTWQKS